MNIAETLISALLDFGTTYNGHNAQAISDYVSARISQFKAVDMRKGDVVFSTTQRENYFLDLLAIWAIGAIPAPLDASSSQQRLDFLEQKAQPAFLLKNDEHAFQSRAHQIPEQKEITSNTNQLEFTTMTASDTAAILFTSGTTGTPKAVPLTYQSLLGNAQATQSVLSIAAGKTMQTALGFQFVSAMSHALVTLLSGASLHTTENPLLADDLAELLQTNHVTHFGGSPIQIKMIAERAGDYHFSLEWLMSSGDYLPASTIELVKKQLPNVTLYNVYGLTELAGRFCILTPSDSEKYLGSVGKPIPGLIINVLNDELQACKPMEIGHIYVSGDYVFGGYLQQQSSDLSEHGFKTGDLGYLDNDGYLYLSGRSDNIFKSSGQKVSTIPIANALQSTGYFKDVAVMSVSDEFAGRVPIAFIVPKETHDKLANYEILQKIRGTLNSNHLPRQFIRLDAIPRTGSGKPQYKVLAKIAEDPTHATN